jgi:hypothetical protein
VEFDRWKSKSGTTWAFKLFKEHHTILNSMYWSYIPVRSCADYMYRNNSDAQTTQELFHASGEDAHRINDNLKGWRENLKEFDNWTRLNALVALLSYFEVYLSSVVSLAIESDPGLMFNTSRVIDGITILKRKAEKDYSFYHISETITKGEWKQRKTAYEKTFGNVPKILADSVTELDHMRVIRNNIAHAFGRDIKKAQARGIFKALEIERLSLKRLKRYLELVGGIAKAVDNHLVSNHIGDYDAIFYYHQIKQELPPLSKAVTLRKKLNSIGINSTCNEDYCTELISYYDSI